MEQLRTMLLEKGASLVGFADLAGLELKGADGLRYAVSVAVALSKDIVGGIVEGPTPQYFAQYNQINEQLDGLVKMAAERIRQQGFAAKPIDASGDIDRQSLSATFQHKTAATRAGLGWVGRCALLVTPQFGSAVRLATVLTDAVLPTGPAIDQSRCGQCTACVDACPARAVVGEAWRVGVERTELYDAFACCAMARKLSLEKAGVKATVCGICIAACPWTQKYLHS